MSSSLTTRTASEASTIRARFWWPFGDGVSYTGPLPMDGEVHQIAIQNVYQSESHQTWSIWLDGVKVAERRDAPLDSRPSRSLLTDQPDGVGQVRRGRGRPTRSTRRPCRNALTEVLAAVLRAAIRPGL